MTTDENQAADARAAETPADEKLSEEQRKAEPETDEHHNVTSERETPELTEKPEITDEHREKAKEMHKSYEDDRPAIKMPGTGGAVAGTAVHEWLDDDGNPKYSDQGGEPGEQSGESSDETNSPA